MEILARRAHILLFALYAVILVGFSQYLLVSDSEFWPWNVGFNFPIFMTKQWLWDRIVFYGIFGLVTSLGDNVWQTLHYARAVAALWCCGLLVVTSYLTWHFTGKRYLAWLAPMLVMANMAFASQGYRVRADTLAMFLILSGLLLILRGIARYGIPLVLLSLLVTPKASLFIMPLVAWLVWRQKKWRWWILAGIASVTAVWLLTDALPRHQEYFQSVFKYYLSLKWSSGNRYFLSEQWKSNWWFWTLSLALIYTQRRNKFLLAIFFYYAALMVFYPEPFHFFIAALIPIFAIVFCIGAEDFLAGKIRVRRIFIGIIFLVSLSAPLRWYIHCRDNPKMGDQIHFFDKLDEYMEAHAFQTIFDGVGAFPHRMHPQMYVGPGNPGDILDLKMRAMNDDFPDFLVGEWRFTHMGKEFSNYLDRFYIEVMPYLYLRAFYQKDRVCSQYPRRFTLRRMMAHHRYPMTGAKVHMKTIKLKLEDDPLQWTVLEPPTQKIVPFLEASPSAPLPDCHWYKVAPLVEIPDLGPFNLSQLYQIDR